MDILLVSYRQDPAVTHVSQHLTDLGVTPRTMHTDQYLQTQMLSWQLDAGTPYTPARSQLHTSCIPNTSKSDTSKSDASYLDISHSQANTPQAKTPHTTLQLQDAGAVWYRRLHIGQGLNMPDKLVKQASVTEATLHLNYIIDQLPCPVLHRPNTNERAKNKLWQLERAVAAGLTVPATLCTNHPDEARAFYERHGGDIVAKMIAPFALVRNGDQHVVYTTKVTSQMLSQMNQLTSCPMMFQATIHKALELRVTVVGGQVFAAAVDSQQLEEAKVDWRIAGADLSKSWVKYDLPLDLQRQLLWLVADLGLIYGAIDLILTPEGQYVFLEVNPAGEYLWLEYSTGLPISAAIAETLVDMAHAYRHDLGMTISKAG